MLIGLLLSRIEVNKENLKKWIVYGFGSALCIKVVSFILLELNKNSEIIQYLFDTKPMNPTIFYVAAASGWAIGFIGLCLMIVKHYSNSKWVDAFAATGQMALTHYLIHSLVVLGIFYTLDHLTYKDE